MVFCEFLDNITFLEIRNNIFKENSLKEFLRQSFRVFDFLNLSSDSRYLESVNLKVVGEVSTRELSKQRNQTIKMSSCLYRLDPFLDEDGLMRVGGRIKQADLPVATKHPITLPLKSPITVLLIKFYHAKMNHMGRGITQNELRQRGYWVVTGSSAVSNPISQCVICRKLRHPLETEKMSDLPIDRVEPLLPFSYCAVDFFGPFLIKERRSEVKRYGSTK